MWSYPTGSRVYSSPAVANGVVYVGSRDDGNVYALKASTGAKMWSYTTGEASTPPRRWSTGWCIWARTTARCTP